MAELLTPNEIFYTTFEPKVSNRFIMYVEGIPSYLIKKATRPAPSNEAITIDHINVQRKFKGKTTWNDVSLELYDPITPSGTQIVMEWFRLHHEAVTGRDGYLDFYKKDITLNELGPVGDKVGEWTLKGALITALDMGEFDWSGNDPMMINVTLAYDYAILQY